MFHSLEPRFSKHSRRVRVRVTQHSHSADGFASLQPVTNDFLPIAPVGYQPKLSAYCNLRINSQGTSLFGIEK